MSIFPHIALFIFLAVPLCAHSGGAAPPTMPSVARPGPGDPGCKQPEFPATLRPSESVTVKVKYLIAKDGAILEGKVVKSSGIFVLDRATLVGLAKCVYKTPAGMQEPTYAFAQFVWNLE